MIQLLPENDAANKVMSGPLVFPGPTLTIGYPGGYDGADKMFSVTYAIGEQNAEADAAFVFAILARDASKAVWSATETWRSEPKPKRAYVCSVEAAARDIKTGMYTRRIVFGVLGNRTVGADKA